MDTYYEVAINSNGPIRACIDGFFTMQLYVSVWLYHEGKLSFGSSIPFEALDDKDDGNIIYDNYDGSGNTYAYTCNQGNTGENKTFRQALRDIVSKKRD